MIRCVSREQREVRRATESALQPAHFPSDADSLSENPVASHTCMEEIAVTRLTPYSTEDEPVRTLAPSDSGCDQKREYENCRGASGHMC